MNSNKIITKNNNNDDNNDNNDKNNTQNKDEKIKNEFMQKIAVTINKTLRKKKQTTTVIHSNYKETTFSNIQHKHPVY